MLIQHSVYLAMARWRSFLNPNNRVVGFLTKLCLVNPICNNFETSHRGITFYAVPKDLWQHYQPAPGHAERTLNYCRLCVYSRLRRCKWRSFVYRSHFALSVACHRGYCNYGDKAQPHAKMNNMAHLFNLLLPVIMHKFLDKTIQLANCMTYLA